MKINRLLNNIPVILAEAGIQVLGRINSLVVYINLIFVLSIRPAFSMSGAGTTGAEILNLGVSARSIAMGNAYTGVAYGGVIMANYNPAGLYGTIHPELSFMHYRYLLDSNFSYLGYAQPLGKTARSVLAANFIYGMYGSVDETQVNVGQDSGFKTGNSFSSYDSAGTLSYMFALTKKIGVGVNLKYFTEDIAGARASSPAGDFGLMYRMGPRLSIGFAARNIGPALTFDRESVPLPFNYGLGFSYSFFKDTIIFISDFEKPLNQTVTTKFGGEVNLGRQFTSYDSRIPQLSLRMGYDGMSEIGNGVTFGGGLKVGSLSLDYAFVPFGQLGEAHRISATFRFGNSTTTKETPKPKISKNPDE